jgi:hypothetical protein
MPKTDKLKKISTEQISSHGFGLYKIGTGVVRRKIMAKTHEKTPAIPSKTNIMPAEDSVKMKIPVKKTAAHPKGANNKPITLVKSAKKDEEIISAQPQQMKSTTLEKNDNSELDKIEQEKTALLKLKEEIEQKMLEFQNMVKKHS